ncbi:hypothetical protein FRB99_000275 [Tulasnella sp. 403]|nr:hypothetical protein FRB99_000275 [Tulasnella sp. 403]
MSEAHRSQPVESAVPSGQRTPNPESVTLKSDEGDYTEQNEKAPKSSSDHEPTTVEKAQVSGYDESKLVTGYKLALIFTIVATAIPRIASQFNALQQVTWIASAYFLTQAGLMLTYGQVLRVATTKWVYLFAITIFEIGSVICGAAPNINVLIFGRAFAGVGAAGIFVSCLAIIATITRLEQRPILFGLFGGVFALSSVVGPLMGGAFTDHVSWRWCFYINLPFGAITIASIVLFIKPEHSVVPLDDPEPTWKRLLRLDWVGSVLCLAMVTSLLLPLQWGGVTKPWTDKSVIACFCVFGVLLPAFIGWEWYLGDKAIMPLHLFKRRTQIGCCIEAFFVMLVLLLAIYYLPLYYQSAEEHTATQSGIDILVYMICTVFGAAGAGAVISKTGRPLPFLIVGPLISTIGSGLIYWDLTNTPSRSHLFGFQCLLGLGVGVALQNTIIAIQAEYVHQPEMVPQSTSLVNFTQLVGGIVGIAVAGTIFGNQLSKYIALEAPNLPAGTALALRQSVQIIHTLSGEDKAGAIKAYSTALGYTFIIGIPAGILGSVAAVLIRNFDLRKMNLQPGAGGAA